MFSETSKSTFFKNPAKDPLFSGKDLWQLIYPLTLGFVLSLLVGMLDTVMVASVGEEAVSGVSLVDSVIQVVLFLLTAFATGGAVVAGQYLGSSDREAACRSTRQLIYFSGLAAVVLVALMLPLRHLIFESFFGDITDGVAANADIYLFITLFSLPAMAVMESGMATFRTMSRARMTLVISMVMNVLNVSGNAYLIYVAGMGTAGAAISTLVSRWVAALVVLVLLYRPVYPLHLTGGPFRFDWGLVYKILSVGLPNGAENGIFQLGKLLVVRLITQFGTAAIAANAVAVILTNIISIPGWAISQSFTTIISRCVGKKDFAQARYYNRILMLICAFALGVWGVCVCVTLPLSLSAFSLSAEALSLARWMIMIHAVGSVVLWSQAFANPAALRAAGDVNFAMVVSILSMWVFRVGGAYIFANYLGFGAVGVWLAMMVDWAFRAVVFFARWRSGKWETKRVV